MLVQTLTHTMMFDHAIELLQLSQFKFFEKLIESLRDYKCRCFSVRECHNSQTNHSVPVSAKDKSISKS
jgi:hypothetical protein